MKSTKKILSIFLAVLMLMTCVSVTFTVYASANALCSSVYATNPDGKVGLQKTITIDGDASDWTEDMLIAQGAAWDVANHYKGGHENCVLDTYALFATWDSTNLYVGWQMVNTTDTWAREGDGPLSDGGRVLDVPLILALSVDPTSTSMSNKNTSGGSIWGNQMGVTFDTHVDHLLYMSGKAGFGEPAMFTAVDSNGNTDYSSGCHTFRSTGIEYKMAETNICSKITGLNYSVDPNDVYSESADWVDYKTFKGSSGTHNTKYDSFYEIKIPLSSLGIDKSYIETYGIGAMLVATRGESGLDCIPFDDTMLDNATGSYASDSSTSHEKDDQDVITSDFARIGSNGGSTPIVPTTQPETTQPVTTKPVTTQPVTDELVVNATSNLFPTATKTYDKNANQLTVTYELSSNYNVLNTQWVITYDSSKLKYSSANTTSTVIPNISGRIVNGSQTGIIKGTASNTALSDFSAKKEFVSVVFDILDTGTAYVDLEVQYLGVAYYESDDIVNSAYIVDNSVIKNITGISGFASAQYTTNTAFDVEQSNSLTVNAKSNLFPTATKTYDKDAGQLTVTYELSSNYSLVDSQWVLTYDPTVLSYSSSNKSSTIMPNIKGAVINIPREGQVKGTFSNISLYDFSAKKAFVSVVFDIIGTGLTDVNLAVEYLGVGFEDSNDDLQRAYIVDNSTVKDITGISGFASAACYTYTVFDSENSYSICDVDLDGVISVKDATLIQKYIADISDLSAIQLNNADADRDGRVDISDVTYILRTLAELI